LEDDMAEATTDRILADPEQLRTFATGVFEKLQVPREDAAILADTLVTANLRGVDTHGVMRIPFYANKVRDGGIQPRVDTTPIRETLATALLDGRNGIGQVISYRAMETAVRKAREAGVAFTTVRNSNHFGAGAYYSMMALPHNMVGIALSNASPRLAPTGGVDRLFGNNPWSIAVPAGQRLPVVLDMANSVVAAGKIRVYQKDGKQIPEGWALDREGVPTTDPQAALDGILLAVGGYKGYGITLMMDLLSGVLANSKYGPRVRGMEVSDEPAGTSHSFIALDISAFDDAADFKRRMDVYIDEIKGSRKAKGSETIYLPGELEYLRERERRERGIPVQPKVVEELRAISQEHGVPLEL
jgi:LDH2 family malate/lactate/ureidoglycolate dehydrogenase